MNAQQLINQSKPAKFTAKDWQEVYAKLDKELQKGDIFHSTTKIYVDDKTLTSLGLRKLLNMIVRKGMKHGR